MMIIQPNTIEKITDNEDYIPLGIEGSDPKIPESLKKIIAFYLVNAIFYLRDIFDSKDVL